jgi:hypothetical protein
VFGCSGQSGPPNVFTLTGYKYIVEDEVAFHRMDRNQWWLEIQRGVIICFKLNRIKTGVVHLDEVNQMKLSVFVQANRNNVVTDKKVEYSNSTLFNNFIIIMRESRKVNTDSTFLQKEQHVPVTAPTLFFLFPSITAVNNKSESDLEAVDNERDTKTDIDDLFTISMYISSPLNLYDPTFSLNSENMKTLIHN